MHPFFSGKNIRRFMAILLCSMAGICLGLFLWFGTSDSDPVLASHSDKDINSAATASSNHPDSAPGQTGGSLAPDEISSAAAVAQEDPYGAFDPDDNGEDETDVSYSYSYDNPYSDSSTGMRDDSSPFGNIAFSFSDKEEGQVFLFLLDRETNTYAAFLPGGMSDHAHISLPDNMSITLNGIRYQNGDSLPEYHKTDERNHDGQTLFSPEYNADDPDSPDLLWLMSYAGMPVSYHVTDGVLIDAEIADSQGTTSQGYIRFFYGTGLSSLFISTSGSVDKGQASSAGQNIMSRINQNPDLEADISLTAFDSDGKEGLTTEGTIRTRGHATSSATEKSYSLNLGKSHSLLGMTSCRKWALLNSFRGNTQRLCDKAAFDLAGKAGMAFTPESTFVNVYIDGVYNGMYLLAQRVNSDGGSVKIHDLRKENKSLNPDFYEELKTQETKDAETGITDRSRLYEGELLQEGTDRDGFAEREAAMAVSPPDISGGYLLEFDNYYDNYPCYFNCGSEWVSVRGPKEITDQELDYISDYMKTLDRALWADDGKDPESGISWTDLIDLDSWAKMYVMEEFFVETDMTWSSFYMYKEKDDIHLYAGPVWDFELSMGHSNRYLGTENHPESTKQTLWIRSKENSWLHRMGENPVFMQKVLEEYQTNFTPIVKDYIENEFDALCACLPSSMSMNAVRWNFIFPDPQEEIRQCRQWLSDREEFLTDYVSNPESYCTVTFHYSWGNLPVYLRKNEAIGFLPDEDYYETDHYIGTEEDEYGRIDYWVDAEGNILTEQTEFSEDTDLYPRFHITVPEIGLDTETAVLHSFAGVLELLPELDSNVILITRPEAWTESELQTPFVLDFLQENGISREQLTSTTGILIIEQPSQGTDGMTSSETEPDPAETLKVTWIPNADESGAEITMDGVTWDIFFGDDQFGIYRNGSEVLVADNTCFPKENKGLSYVALTLPGDWNSLRYKGIIDQP